MIGKTEGFVYLVQPKGHNVFKIGCTTDINRRIQQIQKKLGRDVHCIHYFKSRDYFTAEQRVHCIFETSRLSKEWFILSDEEINKFCQIKDNEL